MTKKALLVANSHHARLFSIEKDVVPEGSSRMVDMRLVETGDFIEEKPKISDVREDAQKQHGEDNKLSASELLEFSEKLAHALFAQYQAKKFEKLVLIAPAEVASAIEKKLHTDVAAIVKKRIDANIVKFEVPEILAYLQKHSCSGTCHCS